MDENNRNFILAIVLSIVVLVGWQYFYGVPKMQEEQARKGGGHTPESLVSRFSGRTRTPLGYEMAPAPRNVIPAEAGIHGGGGETGRLRPRPTHGFPLPRE